MKIRVKKGKIRLLKYIRRILIHLAHQEPELSCKSHTHERAQKKTCWNTIQTVHMTDLILFTIRRIMVISINNQKRWFSSHEILNCLLWIAWDRSQELVWASITIWMRVLDKVFCSSKITVSRHMMVVKWAQEILPWIKDLYLKATYWVLKIPLKKNVKSYSNIIKLMPRNLKHRTTKKDL